MEIEMKNLQIQFVSDQAPHACETCKKRKRKCDKGLPLCSACVSKGLRCDYSDSASRPQVGIQLSNKRGQRTQVQQSQLPSVFFLDNTIFKQVQMNIPTPSIPIPTFVADLIGHITEIRTVASIFFGTVHAFLPIISKKNFFDILLNPFLEQRADVAFLCLSMKVIVWVPSACDNDPMTADYLGAKQYISELENAGVFTIPMLQGRLLMSMYELGHGIYPAAYISIGVCAAHGIALGLDQKSSVEDGGRRLTWVEQEERRRLWWAVIIMERIMYLGMAGRPFVSHDPTTSDLLPSDDSPWDQGITSPNYPINSPVGSEVNMGRYARLAHATHLLAQVIQHTSFSFTDTQIREEEIVQLDRTIRALMVVCEQESQRTSLRYCNPISICASALIVLHSHYAYIEPLEAVWSSSIYREASWIALQGLSQHLVTGFHESIEAHRYFLPEISPLVLHSVYKTGVFFIRLGQNAPSQETTQSLQTVKDTLKMKDRKWRISGAYLRILEAREIMNA